MSSTKLFVRPQRLAVQRSGLMAGVTLLSLFLLGGCAGPLGPGAAPEQQLAAIRCISDCQHTKDACVEDARYDYQQCQAGYSSSFRDYRGCLASAADRDDCGYPWWSCAENLYGYCTNRYSDCERACRDRALTLPGTDQSKSPNVFKG